MATIFNRHSGDDFVAKIIKIFISILLLSSNNIHALTIDQAVALTLKNNFDIESATLDRRSQKFAVKVSEDAFKWQNGIVGESTLIDGTSSNVINSTSSITPTSSLRSKYGTEFSFEPHFHLDKGLEPEIVLSQNLIRGFNPDVNLADLRNAIEQNEIDKVNYQNIVSSAISETLIIYLDIISTDRKIVSLKRSLKINRDNLDQVKIKFQFGEAAKTDIVNKRISVASSLSDLTSTESERESKINNLLNVMNVKGKNITIKDQLFELTEIYQIPTKEETEKRLFNHNLDYLNLKMTLAKNKRSLIKVNDDKKVGLKLIGTTNPRDTSASSIKVSLDAPIHDILKEQSVVNANVAIQKNETAIKSKKIELANHANDLINELKLLKKSIQQQKQEVELRVALAKTNQERFNRGYISSFQLSEQINEKEEAVDKYSELVSSFASKAINLYDEMGLTLERWNVHLSEDF